VLPPPITAVQQPDTFDVVSIKKSPSDAVGGSTIDPWL